MTDVATILPTNATDLELAAEQVVARVGGVPVPIREALHPDTAPPHVLPFIAWERSVDIWDRDWPLDKKRKATRRSISMHRLKGTLAGIRAHLDLEDVPVVDAIVPPQKIFSGASLTRAEREAWLATLPQVRVWRFNERGSAKNAVFMGGKLYRPHVRTRFFVPSTAAHRLRRRARYVVNGIETDIALTEFGSYFRLHLPGNMRRKAYSGSTFGQRRFYAPSTAFERVVTIAPVTLTPWRSVIGPRLTPVTSEPETVAERGQAGFAVFTDHLPRGRFFVPSTARYRLFERYAVTTGGRSTLRKRRPAVQFMGVGRYGIAPHHAELKIEVRGKRRKFAAGEGITFPRARYWLPRDPEKLERSLAAVRAAKRLSDRIKIDTQSSFRFIAGRPAFAGDRIVI